MQERQRIGSDYCIGTALNDVADMIHISEFALFKIRIYIRKWAGGFQQDFALLI